MLQIMDEAAKEVVLNLFPNYERVAKEIHVRITNYPIDDELRYRGGSGKVSIRMGCIKLPLT